MSQALLYAIIAGTATLVAALGWLLVTINRIIRRGVLVEEAWANVVAALVRRRAQLPALAASLAGAMQHELTLVDLANARAVDAGIVARDERPPELTTAPLGAKLQRDLVALEDDIQGARLLFNRAAARYNMLVLGMPTGLVARALGAAPVDYFDADPLTA